MFVLYSKSLCNQKHIYVFISSSLYELKHTLVLSSIIYSKLKTYIRILFIILLEVQQNWKIIVEKYLAFIMLEKKLIEEY